MEQISASLNEIANYLNTDQNEIWRLMKQKQALLYSQGKLPSNQMNELSGNNLYLLLQLTQMDLVAKQQKIQQQPSQQDSQTDQESCSLNQNYSCEAQVDSQERYMDDRYDEQEMCQTHSEMCEGEIDDYDSH